MIAMRLLLCEDDKNIRYLFKRFVADITSRVAETEYLSKAREICQEEEFDVIVLDLRLLDADKDETLSAIPEMKRTSGASVLVVTGIPEPDIKEQVLKAGADFCVLKGVDFSDVYEALLIALHAAVLKHPRPHAGDDYLHHVAMLEKLVHVV
jgi:DNA-binding response OmpR family regulator